MKCKACEATKNGGMLDVSLHTCEIATKWNSLYKPKYKSIEQALEARNLTKEQRYRLVDNLIDGIIREANSETITIEGTRLKHIISWLTPYFIHKKNVVPKTYIPTCGHGAPGINLDIVYCARCYTEGK